MIEAMPTLLLAGGLLAYFLFLIFAIEDSVDEFRKDVIWIMGLLFERGYCDDHVFDILRIYCSS